MTLSLDEGILEPPATPVPPKHVHGPQSVDRELAARQRRLTPATGVERDPEAIERALYLLERANLHNGLFFTMTDADVWPNGKPDTPLGCLVGNPVLQACLSAQDVLVEELTRVGGRERANEVVRRVKQMVFRELERPLINSFYTTH